MNERVAPSLHLNELLTRRQAARLAVGASATLLTAACGLVTKEAITTYRSLGHDYSNGPWHDSNQAWSISEARLDQLLAHDKDTELDVFKKSPETRNNPKALGEFFFALDKDGPVHATFDGLTGDGVSLAVLKATVDDGEQFLVPLIRHPDHPPATTQLGKLAAGGHYVDLSLEYATEPVDPSEINPRLVQGEQGTIGSFLDAEQPDIYLFDYNNLENNMLLRSYVFVRETKRGVSVAYWHQAADEDKLHGIFGTPLRQLVKTKGQANDFDYYTEKYINKADGRLLRASFAAPYHNRVELTAEQLLAQPTPLRIAALNNNVEFVTDPHILALPKIRLRPQKIADDDQWKTLRATTPAFAQYGLCENYAEGTLRPNRQGDAAILSQFDLDVRDCRN